MDAGDVNHLLLLIERHRRPIGTTKDAGIQHRTFGGSPAEQVGLRHKGLRPHDQLTRFAVMHIKPPGLGRLADCRYGFAFVLQVEQYGWACQVVTPSVMRHLLVIPAELASGSIEGNQRNRVEVVARTRNIVHLRRRVSGTEKQQSAFGVYSGGAPG